MDTVHSTARVCVQVYFFWTDPRLIGYDYHTLPENLWGPRLEMQNIADDHCEEEQLTFQRLETGRFFIETDNICKAARDFKCDYPRPDLCDPSTELGWPESGRMMRAIQYNATISNAMSALADFPFDLDRIDLSWVSTSSYQTLDQGYSGIRVSRTGWNLTFIKKFGDLGQITKLKAFYQAKYQAETIKEQRAVRREMRRQKIKYRRNGVIADSILRHAERLPALNGKALPDLNLSHLPACDRTNPFFKDKSDEEIFRERIGRVARGFKLLSDAGKDEDDDGVSSGSDAEEPDETEIEGQGDSTAWAEGRILETAWSGDMDEWSTLGMSYQIVGHPKLAHAPQRVELNLFVHVKRKYGFYIWKVLLPLYLIQALMYCVGTHPTDDISGRLGFTVTGFLAAFAMLYIVGDNLPKMERLTTIDKVITLTTLSIVALAIGSCAVYKIHQVYCSDEEPAFVMKPNNVIVTADNGSIPCQKATDVDRIVTAVLIFLNLMGNMQIFWEPISHRVSDTASLEQFSKDFKEKQRSKRHLTAAQRILRDMTKLKDIKEGKKDIASNPVAEDTGDTDIEDVAASVSEQVKTAQQMRDTLQHMIHVEDTVPLLPGVNRFSKYVPWECVETYSDYLRRRLAGRRVSGGMQGEVRWARFNESRLDQSDGDFRQKTDKRAKMQRKRRERIQMLDDYITNLQRRDGTRSRLVGATRLVKEIAATS
jgi:hypothetical protein